MYTVFGFAVFFFFFKQKTAYEMRISDWSSDVCSSDLVNATRTPFYTCFIWIRKPSRSGATRRKRIRDEQCCPHQIRRDVTAPRINTVILDIHRQLKIGRASCRERVCQYVSISVVAVSLKKKKEKQKILTTKLKK